MWSSSPTETPRGRISRAAVRPGSPPRWRRAGPARFRIRYFAAPAPQQGREKAVDLVAPGPAPLHLARTPAHRRWKTAPPRPPRTRSFHAELPQAKPAAQDAPLIAPRRQGGGGGGGWVVRFFGRSRPDPLAASGTAGFARPAASTSFSCTRCHPPLFHPLACEMRARCRLEGPAGCRPQCVSDGGNQPSSAISLARTAYPSSNFVLRRAPSRQNTMSSDTTRRPTVANAFVAAAVAHAPPRPARRPRRRGARSGHPNISGL